MSILRRGSVLLLMPVRLSTTPNAGQAQYISNAGQAQYISNAGQASYTPNAGQASYTPNAGQASHTSNAGEASHTPNAGEASHTTREAMAPSHERVIPCERRRPQLEILVFKEQDFTENKCKSSLNAIGAKE